MYSDHDREGILRKAWGNANILAKASNARGYAEGLTLMQFLAQYAAFAYPLKTDERDFAIGRWISKNGGPQTQGDAIAIMACVQGDTPPVPQIDGGRSSFNRSGQLITLYDCDLFSPLDLALMLLHEGYHARNHLGPHFSASHKTEPSEAHEANTWTFVYNVLTSGLGSMWSTLVNKDFEDIPRRIHGIDLRPGQIVFSPVENYNALMDLMFEPTEHEIVRRTRMILVGVRSNVLYWAEKLKLPEAQIMASIIKQYMYAH